MMSGNLNVLGIVSFIGYPCVVCLEHYRDSGRPAIALLHREDGSPVARATINLPEQSLAPNEVVIKNYSENAGLLETLVAAGIVSNTGRAIQIGHAVGHICKIVAMPAHH